MFSLCQNKHSKVEAEWSQRHHCVHPTDYTTNTLTFLRAFLPSNDTHASLSLFSLSHAQARVLLRTAYAAVVKIKADRSVPVEDRCSFSSSKHFIKAVTLSLPASPNTHTTQPELSRIVTYRFLACKHVKTQN